MTCHRLSLEFECGANRRAGARRVDDNVGLDRVAWDVLSDRTGDEVNLDLPHVVGPLGLLAAHELHTCTYANLTMDTK